jgi:hypothetical protein
MSALPRAAANNAAASLFELPVGFLMFSSFLFFWMATVSYINLARRNLVMAWSASGRL